MTQTVYDIFNGDADGICALHQLRLARPAPDAQLVTGVKRDIALLEKKVFNTIEDGSLTVLDVSLDSNHDALLSLLSRRNTIVYIDHHSATDIPESSLLECHIVTSAETCTSLIVNRLLDEQFAGWAICGAFGDNLNSQAAELAKRISLSTEDLTKLQEIGVLLNYNGYGSTLADLHFHPRDLYLSVSRFTDPLDYFHKSDELATLRAGFTSDMEQAAACPEHPISGKNRAFIFPDAPWARRVLGVFGNKQARENPESAHALITRNTDSTLRISVRAPLADRRDADVLCKQFPTGGGRAGAAGVNSLSADRLDEFLAAFNQIYR